MAAKSKNVGMIDKKSVIWNMIGSVVASASSFVLLLCVTRTVGAKEGGIFSLAFATAQILLTIGKFGVRSYQATDIKNEIRFGTYLKNRVWFCIIMVLCSLIYVVAAGYDFYKSTVFVTVCVIKMVDALEDVFHGQLQNCGRLDVAGILLTVRNLFTMILFGTVIAISRNMLLACLVTAVFSVIFAGILNLWVAKCYIAISSDSSKKQFRKLIKSCIPLFIGSFLSLYIYNAPKYALDRFGSEEEITYYAIIFMPAFVINLFSEFVFKPLLTQIALLWNSKDFTRFHKTVSRLLLNIVVVTFFTAGIAYLCGAQILSAVYKVDIMNYRNQLIVLIISGGFSAAVYLLYNVLTSMRLQGVIIFNYGFAAVLITVIAFWGVHRAKINGAVAAYLFTEIILLCSMLICTYRGYRKGVRDYESGNRDIPACK